MIIHTNAPASVVYDAAFQARANVKVETRGSRTHTHAFHVTMVGSGMLHSNRKAMNHRDYAATWDQWGVFLAAIFRADQEARCGNRNNPTYANGRDFHLKTNGRFGQAGFPADYHGDHSWTFVAPRENACSKCSAIDSRFAFATAA